MLTPKHRALFHAAYSATLLRSAPQVQDPAADAPGEPDETTKTDAAHELPPSGPAGG
jgi:hypothetical protein